MSTIKEIIERVDAVRPNSFPETVKLRWVSQLDGKVAAEIMLLDICEIRQFNYRYPEDIQREPLVQFPHDDLYDAWLEAMIDYEYGEYNRYQNSMQVYNARYGEYLRWFAERYEPAQGDPVKGIVPRPGHVSYYITAYGLAVMNGYQGTLDEWLWSLKGDKGDKGDKGEPFATLKAGSVQMLDENSSPYVVITGTSEAPVLNFGIPGMSGGLCLKGNTAQIDADSPLLDQGYYEIVPDKPVYGITEGFMIHLLIIPGAVAAQIIASSDADVMWVRSYWKGMWHKFRQIGFGYGTEAEMPENPQDGQLFLVQA